MADISKKFDIPAKPVGQTARSNRLVLLDECIQSRLPELGNDAETPFDSNQVPIVKNVFCGGMLELSFSSDRSDVDVFGLELENFRILLCEH